MKPSVLFNKLAIGCLATFEFLIVPSCACCVCFESEGSHRGVAEIFMWRFGALVITLTLLFRLACKTLSKKGK